MNLKDEMLEGAKKGPSYGGFYSAGYLEGARNSPLLERAIEALREISKIYYGRDYFIEHISVAQKALAEIEEARR